MRRISTKGFDCVSGLWASELVPVLRQYILGIKTLCIFVKLWP